MPSSYLIIDGPKGAGKSTLIDYVLNDQNGIVKIELISGMTKEQIIKKMCLKLLKNIEHDEWMEILIEHIRSLPTPPTIVFEIEGVKIENLSDIDPVRSLCKNLNHFANCIIVLSEPNSILHFGRDRDREKVVYVGEFSPEEAQAYLKSKGINLTQQQLDSVFSQVGTMPIKMSSLVDSITRGQTVEEFVRSQLSSAWDEINEFPDKLLLQTLKEYPDGIPRSGKNLQECMLTNQTSVITVVNKRIVLQSTALKTALQLSNPCIS